MAKCERCGKDTPATIMSMFNTQMICVGSPDSCKAQEEQRPDYREAVAADEAAIKTGDYNFKGIGLR